MTKYFSVVRGVDITAVQVQLCIHINPNEHEINDLFEEMRQVFTQAKAGDAAPVSAVA